MSDNDQPSQTPIAVVGVSALMPGSNDVAGFWRTVVDGRDLIRDVPSTHWLIDDYFDQDPTAKDRTYARRGAFLDPTNFDTMEFGVPPNTLEATDTAQLLALVVARKLLADVTGGDLAAIDRGRVGVILGAAPLDLSASMNSRLQRPVWLKALRENGVDEPTALAVCDSIADHYVPWQEASFPGLLSNVVAGRIANRFDLGGINCTTDAACASSMAAVSAAAAELALGHANMVITGGVDTLNDILMYMCFSKVGALSLSGDCRPFDEAADGTMLGEGLAMVALKRLTDAERDGDHIYAVIKGIGSSSDGRGTSIFAPVAEGQSRALGRAYQAAGYGPDTVELVEAHGTGTNTGDAVELAALASVFEDNGRTDGPWCAVGSLKSQFGHTKAAAGAAGLAKAVLALHHKILPPTIKVDRPNKAIDADGPLYVNTRTRPWIRGADHPRRAGVSSFGFGGTNFHLTLEEYVPDGAGSGHPAWLSRTTPSELVLLSAESTDELVTRCRSLRATDLPAIARRTQQDFQHTDPARLAVVASDVADLSGKLGRAAERIAGRPSEPFAMPGLRFRIGPAEPGSVAFLFSGQGSQYVGMGADIAMQVPEARAVWDRTADLRFDGRAVHQVVFPVPAFTDEEHAAQEKLLTETEWAQPALAVQGMALLGVLRAVGVRPDCLAGHSFGELVALHAAGVYDEESLVRLARRRGELMRDAASTTAGAMLAVAASAGHVDEIVASSGLERLWPANLNSPGQTVLSGAAEDVDTIADRLRELGISCHRLTAATAFHSPLVAAAGAPLTDFLGQIQVREPRCEVFGNAGAGLYPSDPDKVRARIAEHLAQPVRFTEQITAMYDRGVRTFLEVGAGSALTGLVDEILADREHLAVSLDHKERNGVTALQDGLGALAVGGTAVDFEPLWSHYAPPVDAAPPARPGMTVQLLGTNYGKPYPPPGGAAELPPPNPPTEAEAVMARDTISPSEVPANFSAGPSVGPSPDDDEWLRTFQETQRQTADAQLAYQRLMADTHLAYLRSMDVSIDESPADPAHAGPLDYPPMTPPTVGPERNGHRFPSVEVNGDGPALPLAPETPVVADPAESTVTPAVAAPPSAASAGMDMEHLLLQAVADATGYPLSMLDISMELEGDLGIDSIKRVQILSSVRESVPDLPSVDVAELGKLRSLSEIVERFGAVSAVPSDVDDSAAAPPVEQAPPDRATVRGVVRTVPVPASGLAIGGLRGGHFVVTEDPLGIAEHVVAELVGHGVDATLVSEVPSDAWGVITLDGMRDVETVEDAVAANRTAFGVARTIADAFADRGGVFVTVQDTGGDFGMGGRQRIRAWSGGLAALARTAAKEWPSAVVKAIDCERAGRDPGAIAESIVGELLRGGATPDVGLRADGTRLVPRTVVAPITADPAPPVDRNSVIVATGGARGVTAAALRALAEAYRPRIVLIGRTELVAEDAAYHGVNDEPALRRVIIERAAEDSGRRPAPAEVEAAATQVLAAREIRTTLEELERTGSEVRYVAVDVRDHDGLAEALATVRREWGPITGIVHGAGVVADKHIADKSDDQFDRVFDTKVAGLRALLAATASDPLALLCLFSSVASRYGNVGQADYAMANEILNQVAFVEQADRPGCRVRSIAWGPWRGGMVNLPLAEHLENQGAVLMPVDRGAAAFVAELGGTSTDVEVLIAAEGPDDPLGCRPDRAEVRISARTHPYLDDHAIAGTPVLPMTMALEWFDAMAREHGADAGLTLRDVSVLRAVKLDHLPGDGHRFVVRAGRSAPDTFSMELLGDDETVYYRAHTDPCDGDLETEARWQSPLVGPPPPADDPIYDGRVLFHGPGFRSIREVLGISPDGADATVAGVTELGWPEGAWNTDPVALDGGLQLALLWAKRAVGTATLPMKIGRYRVHRPGPLDGPVRCQVRPHHGEHDGDHYGDGYSTVCDIGFVTEDGSVWAELLDVSLVTRPDDGAR